MNTVFENPGIIPTENVNIVAQGKSTGTPYSVRMPFAGANRRRYSRVYEYNINRTYNLPEINTLILSSRIFSYPKASES